MRNIVLSNSPVLSSRGRLHFARLRTGFTTVELLIAIVVVSVLAAILLSVFNTNRDAARQTQCNARLQAIAIAIDAFRQETGRNPASLDDLVTKKYLSNPEVLHCPADPDAVGTYASYYVIRGPHDSGELPVVVCPYHERRGNHGIQAYGGRFTTQNITASAMLTGANATMVQHPGSTAVAAYTGMALHGGDRIITGIGGAATISFADGSSASLQGGSNVTVLQSFLNGQSSAPLYSLLRQTAGDVTYRVNHGSKFDVATPTATAGALGTVFEIKFTSSSRAQLKCTDGHVRIAFTSKTIDATNNQWMSLSGRSDGDDSNNGSGNG